MEKPVSRVNTFGNTVWFVKSKGDYYFHREDGPAIIYGEKNNRGGMAPYSWVVHKEVISPKKVQAWMEENGFTEEDFGTEAFAVAFKLGFL